MARATKGRPARVKRESALRVGSQRPRAPRLNGVVGKQITYDVFEWRCGKARVLLELTARGFWQGIWEYDGYRCAGPKGTRTEALIALANILRGMRSHINELVGSVDR
jgi:hypothetical protein